MQRICIGNMGNEICNRNGGQGFCNDVQACFYETNRSNAVCDCPFVSSCPPERQKTEKNRGKDITECKSYKILDTSSVGRIK